MTSGADGSPLVGSEGAAAKRKPVAVALFVVCAPVVAGLVGTIGLYVSGNGLNSGALALCTLPALVLLVPAIVAWPDRRVAIAIAALLATDVVYATLRIAAVTPGYPLPLCQDGDCDAGAPWIARLIREDETAYAGIALSSAFGMLATGEGPIIGPATHDAYQQLAAFRSDRPGPNAVLLTSDAEHVQALVHLPPGDGKVPCLVLLHGFGGLLTPYVSLLADSELGSRYAIVAPALGTMGAWWEPDGRDVLARTLQTLPDRVDPDQLWLVGISNGAIGATHLAGDPALGPRFRGAILLVGGDWPDEDEKIAGPVLLIPGREDPRFPMNDLLVIADEIGAKGTEVSVLPVDGDHFVPFTHPDEVSSRMAGWLRTQEQRVR